MNTWHTPSEQPAPEARVPLDGPGEREHVEALRTELEGIAPPGALRFVVQELRLTDGGRPAGVHRLIEAILDVEGNLVPLSLLPALAGDPEARSRIDGALERIAAQLDAAGGAGRDATEIVLDADGGADVRVAFGLEVAPEETAAQPPHPAIHDAAHHVRHCAPDLDDLRDRIQERQAAWWQRLGHRLRAAITRRG